MSERMKFIARYQEGETMSDLCREFGISRKTGYKLLARFEADGVDAVLDRSRRPRSSPYRTPDPIVRFIVEERRAHPTWGPHKLKVLLQRKNPGVKWPSESTMWSLLKKEGLVPGRRRRRAVEPYTQPLQHATAPNVVWCADFKGQFRMGNGQYCYPLTISDACSRYLLGCVAKGAMSGFAEVFREHGLPNAVRTDNGVPFASCALLGLSRLSVWLQRLDIKHERIDAGHPEQNGRHERMHRTLKAETTRPPGANLLQQQERFDRFREEFNEVRPHEALDDATPASCHAPSTRPYPTDVAEPVYPLHDATYRVASSGYVSLPTGRRTRANVYVSTVLANELVGVREIDDARWLITFMDRDLGVANLETHQVET
jgi:transposase InsO family protein